MRNICACQCNYVLYVMLFGGLHTFGDTNASTPLWNGLAIQQALIYFYRRLMRITLTSITSTETESGDRERCVPGTWKQARTYQTFITQYIRRIMSAACQIEKIF